jgi:hypothetical protein
MTSKVKSSMLDLQSQITAVSGSAGSPGATLSGYWQLDQQLKGNLNGNATTATTLQTSRNLNGVGFNGSQDITVPLNTTTTTSSGNYYIPFVSSNSAGNQQAYTNGNFNINPNSGTLSLGGAINATNLPSSSTIGASVSIAANASVSGTNRGDQDLSGYAPLASPTFTGYVTIPNTLNMSAAAGSPSISFNNGGVLTPQQTLGTYQGVGAQTSVGLVFGHASPGGTPTGATYIEIGNTATADGSNAQLWVKSDTSQIQVLSQASGNSSAAGGGSAGLYGNSTNGMFLWENTGSIIKFVIGGNLTTPQMTIDNNGNVVVSGNITAYSDITLKDNIINIKDALNKVIQVNGVIYTRKDLEDKQRRYTGVIAQEIEKILPEAVMSDSDGIKSVAYGNLVGLLIEAIKELNDKVDNLQKQLDEKNNDTTNN